MTRALYLDNTYNYSSSAIIVAIGEDEKGKYLLLDQTIFYPQGGGQPSDRGYIEGKGFKIDIHFVRQVGTNVHHYPSTSEVCIGKLIGTQVTCHVNQERRILNASYHTAAHLIGNIVENLAPALKAVKGHSFPGEAYVEFTGMHELCATTLTKALKEAIGGGVVTKVSEILPYEFEATYYSLPYPVPSNKKFRVVQIGNYAPVPCGGTHLHTTKEIGIINIRKVSSKPNRTRISYEVV